VLVSALVYYNNYERKHFEKKYLYVVAEHLASRFHPAANRCAGFKS